MSDSDAKEYITNYCNLAQQQAFDDAGTLLNDVILYMSQNSNTMKNGRNPETGEAYDDVKELEPLTVNLDASKYNTIPNYETSDNSTSNNTSTYLVIGLVVIVIACGFLYQNKKHSK